jgi:hypothetical protein
MDGGDGYEIHTLSVQGQNIHFNEMKLLKPYILGKTLSQSINY